MQIIFPRSHTFSLFCEIVNDVNVELGNLCSLYQILFLKPNDEWLQANRKLNLQLFWKYDLHLSKTGYLKLATSLFSFISSCSTSNSTSFDLRKMKFFSLLSKNNIHISNKKSIHHFKKYKFTKREYIYKLAARRLHVCEVSKPVP